MKILCIIDELGSGGAQRQLINIALSFKEQNDDVEFLTYHPSTFYSELLAQYYIKETCLIESNYLKRIFRMRRFVRQGNYDCVISFLEGASFISELAAIPYKKWTLIVGERSSNPRIFKSFRLRLYRWFHLFSDYVVANSYANIKMVRSICPLLSSKKCKVVYNSIDLNLWKPNDDYVFCKNCEFSMLIAASHREMKNLIGLVEGVNLLSSEEKKKLKIYWYGDDLTDNSKNEALDLIQKYQLEAIFCFYPATLNIKEKMEDIDCVGLFSLYEGLPNVICEGMALGKPIVSSIVSDVPLLLNDGEGGFLCDPKDYQSICLALHRIMSCSSIELEQMGKKNRENAVKLFDRNTNFKLYKSLIN